MKNKKKKNRELRMRGKKFLGYSKPKDQKKTFHNVQRQARIIGERCKCKERQKGPQNKCFKLSDDQRQTIFKRMWSNLNWEERKVFVCGSVTLMQLPGIDSRRKNTFKYTLNVNNEIIQVCKKMYISTTGLREWSIQNWVKRSEGGIKDTPSISDSPYTRKSDLRLNFLQKFLDDLNKLPSHYCRKDTKKLYLEQNFQSIMDVYTAYETKCKELKIDVLSHFVMRTQIKQKNIGLYRPKKDWCDLCFKHKSGNLPDPEYLAHIDEKNRARDEKEKDKTDAEQNLCHALTMDVQAVKICPCINASALYYRTKLCCHNFTIFDLAKKAATCYWFDETVSDGQASTYASCLVDYLEKKFLKMGSKIHISFYLFIYLFRQTEITKFSYRLLLNKLHKNSF